MDAPSHVDPRPPSDGPSPGRYRRARARTRAALLDAARQVMADSGVEGTTIADIAARAGVSPGTFYNYFDDVPAVLDALVGDLIGYIDAVLTDVHSLDLPPAERFVMGVDRVLRLPEQDPAWAWCLVRFEPTMARLREALSAHLAMRTSSVGRPSARRHEGVLADVVIGTMVASVQSRLQGRADASANGLVAEALLRALGLPGDDARAAAGVLRRRPPTSSANGAPQ